MRTLYATDASAYREMPLAVAIPQTENDLKALIQFTRTHRIGLIPHVTEVRSMLMNHLYYNRGKLRIYLQASGKKVPRI